MGTGRKGREYNVPNRLIRHHNLTPILNLIRHSLKLLGHHLNRTPILALLQALTTAQNDAQPTVQRRLRLGSHERVVFLQDDPALRVAQDRPRDAAVLELVRGDLAREGARWLVEDVLRGDFEAGAEVLAREEKVEGGWGDDDLWWCVRFAFGGCAWGLGRLTSVGVELRVVQVSEDLFDGLDSSIPLGVLGLCSVCGRYSLLGS